MGPSWPHMGPSSRQKSFSFLRFCMLLLSELFPINLDHLAPCWANFAPSWAVLALFVVLLAFLGGHLGVLWGVFGAMLGLSWLILGPSWAALGPRWGSHGPSRGHFGHSYGHLRISVPPYIGISLYLGASISRCLARHVHV